MALLDGLDQIDWSSYEMVYLPAVELPGLLRALADGARDAGEVIHKNLVHQMTVWSASAKAIPFLVEILVHRRDDVDVAVFVLGLLRELGTDGELFAAPIEPAEEVGGTDDNGLADAVRCFHDCHVAIERELPSIVPFVDSPDDEVARLAIDLLGSFPGSLEVSVPALERLLAETGGRALDAAIALARLLGPDAQLMARDMLESDDPVVATCGACAAVLTSDEIFDDSIVSLLALAHVDTLGDYGLPIDDCFDHLLDRDVDAVIHTLARLLARADDEAVSSLTAVLFGILFAGSDAPASATQLSAAQRTGLEAVRDHGAFDSADYVDVLEERGLPVEREAFAGWLD